MRTNMGRTRPRRIHAGPQGLTLELQKLSKGVFDLDAMLNSASDLKTLSTIRKTLERQFSEPDDEFLKWLFGVARPNARFVQSVRDSFSGLVKSALTGIIRDRVNERIQMAFTNNATTNESATTVTPAATAEGPVATEVEAANDNDEQAAKVETTEEELQGFQIVRAIVCAEVPSDRVGYRDALSYFSILLDDNNRRTICRLRFNGKKTKYIGLFDADKKETRHAIEHLDDIYKFAETLRETARRYGKAEAAA